jgi:hypothetical protein
MLPNSDSDSKGVPRPHDVNWIYSTFTSRATAEALLSPERESGNLTTNDYNNAIQFLPGAHRYYPVRSLSSLAFYEISLSIYFLCDLDCWVCCWRCLKRLGPYPKPPSEQSEAAFSRYRHIFNLSYAWGCGANICTCQLPA